MREIFAHHSIHAVGLVAHGFGFEQHVLTAKVERIGRLGCRR